MTWTWPLAGAFLASTAALAGSGLILMFGEKAEDAGIWLLSFAIGTLLGASTLGLMPQAMRLQSPEQALSLYLAGIVGFIVFERVLRWRHPHRAHHGGHPEIETETATMILWGDALHNFIDGLIIGVSFDVGMEMGIVSSLAILAHELPQEIGDFAVLISSGMNKTRAVVLNYLSALTVIPGAIVVFGWSGAKGSISWLLPIAAGGFVYIALSDLVPAVHHRRGAATGFIQIILVLCGIAVIWLIGFVHG